MRGMRGCLVFCERFIALFLTERDAADKIELSSSPDT